MLALNLTTAVNASRAAIPAMVERRRRRDRLRRHQGRLPALQRRRRIRDLEVGGAGPGAVPGCGVPRRRHPRQRDRSQRHRHPGQPRVDARRRLLASGCGPAEIARVIRFLCSEDSAPDHGRRDPRLWRRRLRVDAAGSSQAQPAAPSATSCSSRSRSGLSAMGDWVAITALGLHVEEMTDYGYAVAALWICLFGPSVAVAGPRGPARGPGRGDPRAGHGLGARRGGGGGARVRRRARTGAGR